MSAGSSAAAGGSSVKRVTLRTSDEQLVEVDVAIAEMSTTLRPMLEGLGSSDGGSDEPIPLPNVQKRVLEKVIAYCEHHKNDAAPPEGVAADEPIVVWDEEFCKMDMSLLFELILAANYLDIRSLLDVTCKTVANIIRGKSTEEIRRTFNIKNDFSPEEEEQVRKENEWCEDRN